MQTLKKHYGKITAALLICIVIVALAFLSFPEMAKAATTWPARSMCLENWVNQSRITNPYLVILVVEGTYAGKVVKADGTIAADTAYADADLPGVDDAVSDEPVYSIPALPKISSDGSLYRYRFLLRGRAGATAANTDTCYDAGNYDPDAGHFYSNTVPIAGDRVKINF